MIWYNEMTQRFNIIYHIILHHNMTWHDRTRWHVILWLVISYHIIPYSTLFSSLLFSSILSYSIYHFLLHHIITQSRLSPCLSLDVNCGQSLISLISLEILLMMKYGLFVTRSNSQISSNGRRFDSSVGCRNPCTCSCSTDKDEKVNIEPK